MRGWDRLVAGGKLDRVGRPSASLRRGRCRQGGLWLVGVKAGSRLCHYGESYQTCKAIKTCKIKAGVIKEGLPSNGVPSRRVRDLPIYAGVIEGGCGLCSKDV